MFCDNTNIELFYMDIMSNLKKIIPIQKDIQNQLSRLTFALNIMGQTIYEWDTETGEISWSENASEVTGISNIGDVDNLDDFLKIVYEEDRWSVAASKEDLLNYSSNFELDYRIVSDKGKLETIKDSGLAITGKSGRIEKIIGMISVAEVGDDEVESSQFSTISKWFLHKLEEIIKQCRTNKTTSVFMILSIRNYGMIGNGYGYKNLEVTLRALREKILHILPAGSLIERIHRDQFGIIIKSCPPAEASEIALMINNKIQSFAKKYPETPLHIMSAIGSVTIPYNTESAVDALNKAYLALEKAGNHSYSNYDYTADDEKSRNQMELANYLREAIDKQKLRLAFQPIINSKTGEIAHYECLLRFISDDGTLTSAGLFIPVAEQMGLIDVVDELVLDMVVEELKNDKNISLAFNVSNLTTENQDWFNKLKGYIEENPEIAERMVVEITETAAQDHLDKTAFFVASVQGLGCKIALDDFGSGYTSFQQLKTLSVDIVKIDGSFVLGLDDSPSDRLFIKTLMEFINGFDLEAVAECIETGAVAKILMEMGVHYMQGYFFGKPEATRQTWK